MKLRLPSGTHLIAAGIAAAALLLHAEDKTDKVFQLRGSKADGATYTGQVVMTKLSEHTGSLQWTTGRNKETIDGLGVRGENALATGLGPGLYAVAIYEIDGKHIKAVWSQANKPQESGTYLVNGSDFDGECPILSADGSSSQGSVVFTPTKSGIYQVEWHLPTGKFTGIGLRRGDALAAVSGDPQQMFGVGLYGPKGNDISGTWATTATKAPGTEIWSLEKPSSAAADVPSIRVKNDGTAITFSGETYLLKENKSGPGKPTSELREYLRKGDDWDTYSKLIALRKFTVPKDGDPVDAATFARNVLSYTKKRYPGAYVKEIHMSPASSNILFIVVTGDDVEFNLWNYRKTAGSINGAQLVLRNKAPYATQSKFKKEQDTNYDAWLAQINELGEKAEAILQATGAAAPAASGKSPDDKELAKAISADLEKCGALGEKFIELLQAGEPGKAVELMSDRAFVGGKRSEFVSRLEKSAKTLGKLKDFKPDGNSVDFGVKEGVMTFTLEADATYEKSAVPMRETFRFIRNGRGGIELVSYTTRATKK